MLKITPILFLLMTNSSFAEGKKAKNSMEFTKSKGHELSKEVVELIKKTELKIKTVGDKRVESMDNNKDGKTDSEMTFLGNKLFKEKVDFNNDGVFDKVDWYFQSGDIFHTTTIDSNYNGKVDVKIVRTFKGAKKGSFKKVVYRDKDHDGKFDSKQTEDVDGHQKGAARMGNGDCSNCSVNDYSEMHLPGILDRRNFSQMEKLISIVKKENLHNYYENREIQFDLKIQNACQQEGSRQDKELFGNNPSNISSALKNGLECMGKLAHDRRDENGRSRQIYSQAGINFRKAIAGLIGYEIDGRKETSHGASLSLVCKVPEGHVSWTETHSGRRVEAFAMATTSLDARLNRFSNVASAPNIVFRSDLAGSIDDHWKTEYAGQTRVDKFKELVFHEYLHTALGTTHADDEVDYAQACGDYCFHKPAGGDLIGREIKTLSRRICEGEFPHVYDKEYDSVRSRLVLLREQKRSVTSQEYTYPALRD